MYSHMRILAQFSFPIFPKTHLIYKNRVSKFMYKLMQTFFSKRFGGFKGIFWGFPRDFERIFGKMIYQEIFLQKSLRRSNSDRKLPYDVQNFNFFCTREKNISMEMKENPSSTVAFPSLNVRMMDAYLFSSALKSYLSSKLFK